MPRKSLRGRKLSGVPVLVMVSMLNDTCANCGGRVQPIGAVYCSKECRRQAHQVARVCPNCGRNFTTGRANADRGRMKACSIECRDLLRRTLPYIEHNGVLYHRSSSNGRYISRGRRYLHRVIWEEHHGPIPKNCYIRHKDGDSSNNDIANLKLTPHSEIGPYKTKPNCLRCDRPARTRGLCQRHYQQLRAQEKAAGRR
jgi:hypothetical protein